MDIHRILRSAAMTTLTLLALAGCGGSSVTIVPTIAPTVAPAPTSAPTVVPTAVPTAAPAAAPTDEPVTAADDELTTESTTGGTASTSGTITKTLANGFVEYQKPSEGFAIALPEKWQQLDADAATFQGAIGELTAQNPEFGSLLSNQAQTMLASGIKFMGLDLTADGLATGYLPNVNIIKQELPLDVPVNVALEATAQQLEGVPNITKPIVQQVVTLPAGEAGELKYMLKLTTSVGKEAEAVVQQYLFIKNKTLYVVSMGAPVSDAASYEPVFKQIADTFQFLP